MRFQRYNKKLHRYQEYKEMPNGRVKIVNVKERQPTKPFSGVKIRRK